MLSLKPYVLPQNQIRLADELLSRSLYKHLLPFTPFSKDDNLFILGDLFETWIGDDNESEFNKNVIDLSIPNDWVLNHKSFTARKPSEYSIQAFEDTSYYEISIDAIHRLIAQSQSFLQMGKILEESISRIYFFDNNNTPDEKYLHIITKKPELLQKFPQTIIASYLKITPETLSRVRKRIS